MQHGVPGVRPRHCLAFVAVCEERHVGRAAERLRLTQPAVSKTLAELEGIVGQRLLDRGRLGAAPTAAGRLFLPHARAVLDAVSAAEQALAQPGAPVTEHLAVGALPTVAPELLPDALGRFRATAPAVHVELRTETNARLLALVRSGDLDLAVGRMSDPSLTLELTFELLYLESLEAAVRPAHPLAGHAHAALSRLLDFPLLVCTAGTTPRQNAEALFQAQGLRLPPNTIDTLDLTVARQIVLSTDTIWLVPGGAVRHDVDRGWLSVLHLDAGEAPEPVGLFRRGDRDPRPVAAAFARDLRAAAAERQSSSR